MVIPIGDQTSQNMYLVTKTSENKYSSEKFDKFVFVPLIGKQGW